MIVWIASFPRSGNTFFRALLHQLYGHATYSVYNDLKLDQAGMAPLIGQRRMPATIDELRRDERLFFVKTHGLPIDDGPAIYLVRDGRDATVSFAHFEFSFLFRPRFDRRLVWRLRGWTPYRRSLERIVRAGQWGRHVMAWTRHRARGETHVVRYEDLIRDPVATVAGALAALRLPANPLRSEPPSFQSLHERWPNFFRRGHAGAWRDEMPAELHAAFWRRNREPMLAHGYTDGAPAALEPAQPALYWWRHRTGWDAALERLQAEKGRPEEDGAAPSVSMSCLGRHGLWGNTIFQYMYLKAFAHRHGRVAEVPEWMGERLFTTRDRRLDRAHEVVLRDNMTLLHEDANHVGVAVDYVPNRVRNLAERGRRVCLLNDALLDPDAEYELPASHIDLEGLFMIGTRPLAAHREYIRSLFDPVPPLRAAMEAVRERLRARGRTIVGIHVRRGDFDHIYSGQGYEFVAPTAWYRRWLEELWPTLDDPVLLVCSNNIGDALPAFRDFGAICARDIGGEMPPGFASFEDLPVRWQRDARLFVDWFLLQHCDHLAISNSTFSFSAAMLSRVATTFVRPSLWRRSLIRFDPWNAQPLFFLPQRATLPSELAHRIGLAHEALGSRAVVPGIKVALQTYSRVLRMRARTCRAFYGRKALARELVKPAFYLATGRRYGSG